MKMLPLILSILFLIGIASASITSYKQSGKYEEPRMIYSNSFIIDITGNESKWIDKVEIINREVKIIPKELTKRVYEECVSYSKDTCSKIENVTYEIPNIMPVKSSDDLIYDVSLKDEKNEFTYTIPLDTHYLKLGDNSVTIIEILTPNGSDTRNFLFAFYNISIDFLNSTRFNWNGVNTTLYDDSLVLLMNFDNRSALGENDTYVADLSKYGNNGTVVGGSNVTFSPGKYGNSINFSGNKNYIQIADSDTLNYNNTQMTWSWWGKSVNFSEFGEFFSQYTTATNNRAYQIRKSGSTLAVFISPNGTSAESPGPNEGYLIENNLWNMYTITFNSGNLSYYRNSIYTESDLTSATKIFNSNEPLYIGAYTANQRFLNGSIDNVMIWNRSLSADEISQLYNSQITKYDRDNWSYQTNQTNLTDGTYYYQLCASNLTSESCSPIQYWTTDIPPYNPSKIGLIYPSVQLKVPYIRLGQHLKFT